MRIEILVGEYRTSRGITLEQLADKSKISKSTLNRIENEQSKVSFENMIKIAEALDVKMEDLYKIHR